MKRMKDNIIQICKMTEDELFRFLVKFVQKNYERSIIRPGCIIAEGDIPVCLVAHLDTVFKTTPTTFFYDAEKATLWSPDGLGADDRAGVYAILEIVLRHKLKPHIIFTTGEEKGGVGAKQLVKDFPEMPFRELNFLIELDRQGHLECVFYDCANNAFSRFIKNYGFHTDIGTFTDISVIAPAWKVAAVNLSVGYCYEHSFSEFLNLRSLISTISRVVNILKTENLPCFDYVPKKHIFNYRGWWGGCQCAGCAKYLGANQGYQIPDITLDGATLRLCSDCYVDFYGTNPAV